MIKTKPTSIITLAKRWLRPSDWVLLPLLGLLLFSIYSTKAYGLFNPSNLMNPYPLPLLAAPLVGIFCFLYLIFRIKYRTVPKMSRVVAYVFSALLILFAAMLAFTLVPDSMQRSCTGFFGAQTSCSSVNLITLLVILFNPISLGAWGILALTGTIPIVMRLLTRNRSH